MSAEAKTSIPSLTPIEVLHHKLGVGRNILDRVHFTGWADIEADDYTAFYSLIDAIEIPYIPEDGHYWLENELNPYEHAQLMQSALGSETMEDAQAIVNKAARVMKDVLDGNLELTASPDFYEAQDVVRQIWEATLPTEFKG